MAQVFCGARGWELEVERGPGWLFVRPRRMAEDASEPISLAEQVWALLEQNFTRRLVLELTDIEQLESQLIGQLMWLNERIQSRSGMMRICGLSNDNQSVLRACSQDSHFPRYRDRADAVMGYALPTQPR